MPLRCGSNDRTVVLILPTKKTCFSTRKILALGDIVMQHNNILTHCARYKMLRSVHRRIHHLLTAGLLLAWTAGAASAAEPYHPIEPTVADKTVTLTGHDLTIEQLADIARHGAKVAISPELRQGAADSFGLVLEAQAEGVPVYLFNRNAGSGRETVSLKGDPDSPEFKAEIDRRYGAASVTVGESPGFG